MKPSTLLVGVIAHGVSSTSASTSVSVTVPTSYDGTTVDPNFPAFGFEEASFVGYILDGDGNTNKFSLNLIAAVTNRTGGTPIIRLGGTSADYATYVPDQTEPALPLATDNLNYDVGGTTIGPAFWKLASLIPDAQYMVQVPLATTNVSETIEWVQTAFDLIGADQIEAIELGNEPDWYSATYAGTEGVLGPPDWQAAFTNATYVGNYTAYMDAIAAAVDLPTPQIFQAFDTAAHVSADSSILCYELSVETCFGLGIDASNTIKTVAHHYYQNAGANTTDALPTGKGLMNMTFTHWRMDFFNCQLDWLSANRPDLPFVLSEVGNSLSGSYVPQYQAVLGSALWQVDFYLYAMALGIARVHYQQMFAETYQPIMWLPVEYQGMAPHVTANFYSQPLIGDFLGDSGETSMEQLDISPALENVAAYAAFESGEPKRVAIVNLEYWNEGTSATDRSSVAVQLAVPDDVTTVTVDYLDSPAGAGADATTITYGGSQWTYESLGIEVTGVRNDSQVLTVVDGLVTVSVNATSAALISLS